MAATQQNLLDIVNYMLTSIGEQRVDGLVGSHPDVVTCLDLVAQQRKDLLCRGYWFNKFQRTLTPDTNGNIYLPDNILSVDSMTRNDPSVLAVKGNRLYDVANDTYMFDKPLTVWVLQDFPDMDIPYMAQAVVRAHATLRLMTIKNVTGNDVQNVSNELSTSEQKLQAEQLRKAPTGDMNATPLRLSLPNGALRTYRNPWRNRR